LPNPGLVSVIRGLVDRVGNGERGNFYEIIQKIRSSGLKSAENSQLYISYRRNIFQPIPTFVIFSYILIKE